MKSLSLVFLFIFLSLSATAQRTAILGALDQEIAILLDSLQDKKEEQYGGLTFYTGNLKGQAVVIAKSGVGKVNASYSTAILLDHFTPKQLIFTGVAGGLHPESLPGDVVIEDKTGTNRFWTDRLPLDLKFLPSANFQVGDTKTFIFIPIRQWSSKLNQLPSRCLLFQFPIVHRVYSQG